MSLQTLVENSVKYAVSPARDGAAVSVKAVRHEHRLRIAVEDDGPGFDTSRLPEGHGLHLLKSRIALTFGHRGDVTISSRRGHTAVTLDLPFETKS
jgi:LytS/YehU family sensor histidine kinase